MSQENRSSGRLPNSMKYIVFDELMNLVYKLKSENNAFFKVAVLTPAGTIIGDIAPCSYENEMIKYTDEPARFSLDTSSIFDVLAKKYNNTQTNETEYSDAYMINILNAVVYENGMKHDNGGSHFEQIIVFADQIIGFSLVRQ